MADSTSDIMLDPNTGEYYQMVTRQVPVYNYGNPFGYSAGFNPNPAFGGINPYNPLYGGGGGYRTITERQNTGDISMVWKAMQNKTPYKYNVPSISSMFPSMSMPSFNAQPTQYTGGAGQYLGGLLGTDGASQFLSAPTTSSGAGRFA